jgi:hypothetical protein
MLPDFCVTMQAPIQVSAPGRNHSEAVQWNACMGDLQSAAAALDTAVGMVVEAAAEHDLPPPDVVRACGLAVDGVLGASVCTLVSRQARAARRSGQC